MNGIRFMFRILFAVLLVAFALPSLAAQPQKSYSLEFLLPLFDQNGNPNPAYGANGQLDTAPTVQVVIKNESPPSLANSNISSFQFQVTGLNIVDVQCPGASGCSSDGTNTVYVTNISPPVQGQTKPNNTFTVWIKVSSCVAANDANIPQNSILVYNGSSLKGDTFGPVKNDTSFPFLLTLSDPSTFAPTGIACGAIACGGSYTVVNTTLDCTSSNDARCVTAIRGNPDKNGVCTAAPVVDYFVSNGLSAATNRTLHFQWENAQNTASTAVFAYKLNVSFPSGGTSSPVWNVSWLPATGNPVYIAALPCNPFLPDPPPYLTDLPLPFEYGTLDTQVNKNNTNIKVTLDTGKSAPAPGTPIVIGTERMVVVSIGSNSWTVQRGDGLTTATSHPAGAPVMSDPLPNLPDTFVPTTEQAQAGYKAKMQAQMCLAAQHDNGDNTWSAWVIDIGDGWTNSP